MFTGLIESVGRIDKLSRRGNYLLLSISSNINNAEVTIGESISCDGACLTVTARNKNAFMVEASQETAERTILSSYRVGSRINLERAVRAGDRLGGHYVSGHIDTTGAIISVKRIGESLEIVTGFGPEFDRLLVEKGSLAINGISLTVNEVESGKASVNVIPHTLTSTTMAGWKVGDDVNLEFDLIGKYVIKNTDSYSSHAVTKDKLRESGW